MGPLQGLQCPLSSYKEEFLRGILEVTPWDDSDDDEFVLSHEPSKGEIRITINWMKNGKAPEEDMITAELLKLSGDTVVK